MKNLIWIVFCAAITASCRKSSTCSCKNKDGWGYNETLKSNKSEIRIFEQECRSKKVQEPDGSVSPCKVL